MAQPNIAPVPAEAAASGRRRVASLVVGSVAAVLAVGLLAAGTWALWVDRVDRGAGGFVAVGTTKLNTGAYAIRSPLTGDGPSWLYGSTVFGTGRVRATSQNEHPMFIGIARTSDVARYFDGTGYATIQHLASDELTTHQGGPPAMPPTRMPIWAASTQGNGRLTLLWKPRRGEWSIVLMNADASPGVALQGDLAAKVPLLPWVAGGLLLAGAGLGSIAGWLLVRGIHGTRQSAQPDMVRAQGTSSTRVPASAHN